MDQILEDFRKAISQDCMGWFCEKYEIGHLEWEAKTSIDLIRLVAVWLRDQEIEEEK